MTRLSACTCLYLWISTFSLFNMFPISLPTPSPSYRLLSISSHFWTSSFTFRIYMTIKVTVRSDLSSKIHPRIVLFHLVRSLRAQHTLSHLRFTSIDEANDRFRGFGCTKTRSSHKYGHYGGNYVLFNLSTFHPTYPAGGHFGPHFTRHLRSSMDRVHASPV